MARRNEIRSRDRGNTFPEEVRRELERLEDEIGTQRARADSGTSSPTTIGQVGGASTGSVIFGSSTGSLTQDNANFFWDDTNDYLGLGTNTPNSTTHTQSHAAAVETVTASSDTLDDTNHVVICDCTSNAITLNLPAASTCTGRHYHVKKIDTTANAVTIDPNSSETIDGGTTAVINSQYECLTIVCDGSNWHII